MADPRVATALGGIIGGLIKGRLGELENRRRNQALDQRQQGLDLQRDQFDREGEDRQLALKQEQQAKIDQRTTARLLSRFGQKEEERGLAPGSLSLFASQQSGGVDIPTQVTAFGLEQQGLNLQARREGRISERQFGRQKELIGLQGAQTRLTASSRAAAKDGPQTPGRVVEDMLNEALAVGSAGGFDIPYLVENLGEAGIRQAFATSGIETGPSGEPLQRDAPLNIRQVLQNALTTVALAGAREESGGDAIDFVDPENDTIDGVAVTKYVLQFTKNRALANQFEDNGDFSLSDVAFRLAGQESAEVIGFILARLASDMKSRRDTSERLEFFSDPARDVELQRIGSGGGILGPGRRGGGL